MKTGLIPFAVMAITLFAVVMSASAETISASLKDAWPKWYTLVLSEHPNQIFYAIIKNTGTEPVYARGFFIILSAEGNVCWVFTDIVLLPPKPPKAIKLRATWAPTMLGAYTVEVDLWYSADCINWLHNGVRAFEFVAIP